MALQELAESAEYWYRLGRVKCIQRSHISPRRIHVLLPYWRASFLYRRLRRLFATTSCGFGLVIVYRTNSRSHFLIASSVGWASVKESVTNTEAPSGHVINCAGW